MKFVTAAILLDHWPPHQSGSAQSGSPQWRLTTLLLAIGADATDLDRERPGDRNRRLIELNGEWDAALVVLHSVCPRCSASETITLDRTALLALPPAPPDAVVAVAHANGTLSYRLPTMADVSAVADMADPQAQHRAIIDQCALDADPVPAVQLGAEAISALQSKFDALDPLGAMTVKTTCPQCGEAIRIRQDFAMSVAENIDRALARLLQDIDIIASGYGWEEAVIAALPAERRKRYAAMIAERRAGQGNPAPA